MATTDMQRLVVSLEAKVDKFTKALDRANGVANKRAKAIEGRFAQMNTRVVGIFQNFGKGILAGVAAGGVAGIVSQLAQVANGIAQIGDEAKRAGLSTQVFQEWKFVAEQNRIGIDSLVDGFKELNLRGDEFIQTGAGPAAEAFQRLGYGMDELETKLKNPSALLLEIIDRLGKMDKAAQIRIADEIFGGSAGERFVELLAQGERGIRDTINEAHELGAVMDEELIQKAAELDRRFNAVATTVGTALKTAIVEAAAAFTDFVNSFQSMWADFEKRRNAIELGAMAGSLAGGTPDAPVNRTTPKTGRLPRAPWVPPTPPPGGFGSIKTGGGRGSGGTSSIERERKAVADLIAELERELALIGATDLEREISNTLRDAGAAATDKQQERIVALVTALYAEEEATRKATEAAQELRDIGRDVLGGIISDLRTGTSAADILASALDRVADKLLDIALDTPFGGGVIVMKVAA